MIFNDQDRIVCKECDSKQTGSQVRVEIRHGRTISHCKNCGSDYLVELTEEIRNENRIKLIGTGNMNNEGITLVLSAPARLNEKGLKSDKWWVSWDKIGEALFKEQYDTGQN